jgi:hypothetical protein
MGNFVTGMDPSDVYLLGLTATGVATYSGFYLYRDYRKKGIVPVKSL